MFKNLNYQTGFLFSRTGFLIGAGSIFNLAGNYFSFASSASALEADRKALASDWNMVGLNIHQALLAYDAQLQSENAQQLAFNFDGR